MSFVSGVTSTNDQEVDLLFGVTTPGADNLLGAAEKKEPGEVTEKKEVIKKVTPPAATVIDGEPVKEVIDHDNDTDLLLGGEEEVEGKVAPKVEPKKSTPKLPETQEVDLEAIYKDMVAKKLWQEVDIPEGTEWNEETFLQVQKLQASSQYEDLLDRTGSYGKAIIEFEQNGGNPKELLDLFRDQREVQEFDITDTESQETFLRSYLQAQGNSEKSIERQVKALQDQGPEALREEAEEKKAIWDEQYKSEIEARKNEQALYAKQVEDAQRKFQSTIETSLTSDAEVTPKERRELQNYMLNYSQPFQGRQVSQFYVDMAEVQKDPKNYIELAKFVKGLKTGEYTKKVVEKVKKEVSATNFLKIKNNTTIKPSGSGTPGLTDPKASSFLDHLYKK
jgi:hypothetical protein